MTVLMDDVCFVMLKVLRPKLVDEKFMKNLGRFLVSVQSLDAGSTQIQSATGLYFSVLCVFSVTSITGLCVIFQMYTSPNIIFILCMMYNKEVQLSVLIRSGNHGCQHL